MKFRAALIGLILPLTLMCSTAVAASAQLEAISSAIEDVYRDLDRPDGPGCAVGYARHGELIYARQFGMANLEHNIPINPTTVFRIGSTSKQFVAASVALLSLQGNELDADATVPDLRYGTPVTIRQMVNHSSGIPDYMQVVEAVYGIKKAILPQRQNREFLYRMNQLDFVPGSQYAYSNSAYVLLAQAVEAVSGQTMREFAEEQIFAPLGMRNTHFHDNHRELVENRADGYAKIDGRWQKNNTNLEVVGDGGVFSTVEDLIIWYHNFADNRLSGGDELSSHNRPPTLGCPPSIENGLSTAPSNVFLQFGGQTLFGHSGGFVGFVAAPYRILPAVWCPSATTTSKAM